MLKLQTCYLYCSPTLTFPTLHYINTTRSPEDFVLAVTREVVNHNIFSFEDMFCSQIYLSLSLLYAIIAVGLHENIGDIFGTWIPPPAQNWEIFNITPSIS